MLDTYRALPNAVKPFVVILIFLNILGAVTYIARYLLIPPWLWNNQDYMLFLNAEYFHLHAILIGGHLYAWGLFLLVFRFGQRWWSSYWVSLFIAFFLSLLPLFPVQRISELYGLASLGALVAWQVILALALVTLPFRAISPKAALALHLYCGFPVAALALLTFGGGGIITALCLWAVLLIHLLVLLLVRSGMSALKPKSAISSSAPSRRRMAEYAVNAALLVIFLLVCIPHRLFNLLAAKREMAHILASSQYAQSPLGPPLPSGPPPAGYLRFRTYDGSWNNIEHPEIGKARTPLGSYVPRKPSNPQDVYRDPSVLAVSDRLFAQAEFKSAAPVNALAMAWVNFFVHDFYDRKVGDSLSGPATKVLRLPVGDQAMYFGETPTTDGTTHLTSTTHWFDASQVYGSSEEIARSLRTRSGGKLKIGGDGFLPVDSRGLFLTGDSPRSSLHTGLLLLHHLWVDEHNYVASELSRHYPRLTDEELYQTARLIVAAEIVKIHTAEWSAQMAADPISSEFISRFWENLPTMKYRKDLYYAVSEEFISSYVLHEFITPDFAIVNDNGATVAKLDFVDQMFLFQGQEALRLRGLRTMFNSFGRNPMGLLYPFNVPEKLRRFTGLNRYLAPDLKPPDYVGYLDLAAIPLAREREIGLGSYNDVRERLGMPRLNSLRELSRDPLVLDALETLYKDIDDVEFMVGYKAEVRPSKWRLTYTQINAFLPVVVYRVLADRFYTQDLRPEIYTEYGMERLETVKLHDIIKRVYGPALLPADRGAPIFYLWE